MYVCMYVEINERSSKINLRFRSSWRTDDSVDYTARLRQDVFAVEWLRFCLSLYMVAACHLEARYLILTIFWS